MSELEESVVRSQALLMIFRNHGKTYIYNKVLKRFMKCIRGNIWKSKLNIAHSEAI